MKNVITLLIFFLFNSASVFAQDINWSTIGTTKNMGEQDVGARGYLKFKITNISSNITEIKIIENGSGNRLNNAQNLLDTDLPFDANSEISIDLNSLSKSLTANQQETLSDLVTKAKNTGSTTIQVELTDNATPAKKVTLIFSLKSSSPVRSTSKLTGAQKEIELGRYISRKYGAFASRFYNEDNNLILTGKTVHIFLDEAGNTYFSSFPTTSREDYNYQVHLFYYPEENKSLSLEYTGSFDPSFSIYGADNVQAIRATASSTKGDDQEEIDTSQPQERLFGRIGPFTNTFTLNINKVTKEGDKEKTIPIAGKTIKVAPVHHISLTVGLINSFLRNPSNYELRAIDATSNTVIADDPEARGILTLMATFYPKPRNLLFSPNSPSERIGFVVGTSLNSDFEENFFGGLSYDIARGIALTGGIHYGRRDELDGVSEGFKFGTDPYPFAEIKTKKEWDAEVFMGLNIDLRVFGILFNPSGQTK